MTTYVTQFESLDSYEKGGIEVIDDDAKHFAFSNIFEVANGASQVELVKLGIPAVPADKEGSVALRENVYPVEF